MHHCVVAFCQQTRCEQRCEGCCADGSRKWRVANAHACRRIFASDVQMRTCMHLVCASADVIEYICMCSHLCWSRVGGGPRPLPRKCGTGTLAFMPGCGRCAASRPANACARASSGASRTKTTQGHSLRTSAPQAARVAGEFSACGKVWSRLLVAVGRRRAIVDGRRTTSDGPWMANASSQ